MNGIDYLADTNAVLYFVSGKEFMRPYVSKKYAVSVITEMELLSFGKLTDDEETDIRCFLGRCRSLGISDAVKNRTIALRKEFGIKLPDAIIAATAAEHDISLLTADIGFKKLKDKIKLELISLL